MEKPLVSAIITTYNRADIVILCIESLLKSTYDNMEIIVVDNNSTDNSVELIRNFVKKKRCKDIVHIVALKENLMCAGGRNIGIKRSKGEYLLFVDSDNVINKDAVAIMVQDLMENEKVANVAALTIQNDDIHTQRLYAYINLYTSKIKQKTCDYKKDNLDKFVYTGCCENVFMIRKEVISKIGYFDKNYYIMYEDTDFCQRARSVGYCLITEPKARTIHYRVKENEEQTELRALGVGFPLRAFYFARNRTVFMRKYANIYGKILYYLVFSHLFMGYYVFKAIKHKRFDIAKEYLRGYVVGMFMKIDKRIYVPYNEKR